MATVPVVRPEAIGASSSAPWPGPAASATSGANCVTVATNGPGAAWRPNSSSTMASSTQP